MSRREAGFWLAGALLGWAAAAAGHLSAHRLAGPCAPAPPPAWGPPPLTTGQ